MALQTDTPALPPLIRIVDDNDTLRQSLEFMLQCEGYEVVSYASAMEFLKSDSPSRGGCTILDIQMPEMSGLDLFDRLNHRGYEVPVIFLTAHGDIDMAVGAMRDGACDFQTKPINVEKFLPAVARALENDRLRREGISRDIREEVKLFQSLSEREEKICRLTIQGFVSRAIGERLEISHRTVEHYRGSALKKLGLHSSADLAQFFARVDAFLAANPER